MEATARIGRLEYGIEEVVEFAARGDHHILVGNNRVIDAHEVGEPHLRAFHRHQLLESPSHGAALLGFLIPSGNCATSSLLCPLNFLFPPLATGVTSSPLATHVAATWPLPSVSPRDDLA
jgi:hypothetical protein